MAVGLVVFVGFILLGRPLVEGRLTAARNLDRATAMIPGTDGALVTIGAEVHASSATSSTDSNGEAQAAISDARSILQEAALLSQTGYDKLTEDEQRRARIVEAMATARIEALDAAEAVLSAGAESSATAEGSEQRIRDYDKAMEKVRGADAALGKL